MSAADLITDAAPPRPRQAPRPPLEPLRLTGEPGDESIVAWGVLPSSPSRAWRRGFVYGFAAAIATMLCAAALTGCSSSAGADNTPWGKVEVRTDAKPPPPIVSRSFRSTTTKPPPPAPEVEETTCENGVCGVPGR